MKALRPAGIVSARLGWDITDYGQGKFDELGLFLFTVRNGRAEDLTSGHGMLYAEKIMISKRDQLSPMHRHWMKAEDIINRGGGKLVLELYMPDSEGPDRSERGGGGALRRRAAPSSGRRDVWRSNRAKASRFSPAYGMPSGAKRGTCSSARCRR